MVEEILLACVPCPYAGDEWAQAVEGIKEAPGTDAVRKGRGGCREVCTIKAPILVVIGSQVMAEEYRRSGWRCLNVFVLSKEQGSCCS